MELATDTNETQSPRTSYDYCHSEVRKHDPERYFATLFAPAEARDHILSLYAFDGELKRVRSSVSTPLLGEIRLQWWADAVDGLYQDAVRAHPVIQALAATVRAAGLPREPLAAIVEAYFTDLAEEDRRTPDDIARFARGTTGALARVVAGILADDRAAADRAETAGTAWGIVEFARSVPRRPDPTGHLKNAVPALCVLAEKHIGELRVAGGRLPRSCLPVFLTTPLAARYLKGFKGNDFAPAALVAEMTVPRMLLTLYTAAVGYRLRNRSG
jgi:phytoene synthase